MARRKKRDDRGPEDAATRAAWEARGGRDPAPGGVYAMTISALSRTLAALFELKACDRADQRGYWRAMGGESIQATIALFGILTEDHITCDPEFAPLKEVVLLLNGEVERLLYDEDLRELLTTDRRFDEIIDHLKGDNDDQQ